MRREWESFDVNAVERLLQSEAQGCLDPVLGEAYVFTFSLSPELPKPTLSVFCRDSLLLRYRSLAGSVEIPNALIRVEQEQIRIETRSAMAESISYFLPRGSFVCCKLTDCAAPPSPVEAEVQGEQDQCGRVTITGRIGRLELKDTKRGKKMLKFSVAVSLDGEEKPRWETVLLFGQTAEKVAKRIKRGQPVSVIGHRNETEYRVKGPDGPITKKSKVIFGHIVRDPDDTDTRRIITT